jgi:PAS domain S-box-containing protein
MSAEAMPTPHGTEWSNHSELQAEVRRLRARVRDLERELANREQQCDASGEGAVSPQQAEVQLSQILRNAPLAVWQIRADGEITLSDGAALADVGMVPGEIVGKNFFEVFAHLPDVVASAKQALAGVEQHGIGHFKQRTFQSSYRTIRDQNGNVAFALGLAVDITERIKAEADLQQAHVELEQRVEERTAELSEAIAELDREVQERKRAVAAIEDRNRVQQSILSSTADGICVCDIHGNFIEFNPAAERILGRGVIEERYDAWSEHYGLFLSDTETPFPADRLPMVRALRGEDVWEEEIYVRHDDITTPRWLSVNARPLRNVDGEITGAIAAFRDFTEAKLAAEALRAERRFLEYALAVHERDRQLIAYELHDGLVQVISASLMYLEALTRRLPPMDEKATEDFESVVRMLREAMKEARLVISGLRPPILDEQGVVAAIEYLIHEQVGFGAPPIEYEHEVSWKRLDSLLEAMLFRIVQEALTNLRTHSQASHGKVALSESEGLIRVTISDDGVGFAPQKVADNRFGLQGIRKRVALLRGRVEINSAPGKGTRLTIELPIEVGPAGARASQGVAP